MAAHSNQDIPWSRLRQMTGTCEAIPGALRDLCSDDPARRKAAYWQIENHVVVQRDLYEAAPFVVLGLLACLGAEPRSAIGLRLP